ncbi:hypothetical protein AX15_007066 [Amanita polypyramis BW_CC]|nr:hypothetical protein AX15_007066 [Amanita polypyramis BW_CC]
MYRSVLWYNKDGRGIKQKANKLNKVKNMGMRWISGAFSTTPITALKLITYTPPILAQLNITAFKYALCINKLSAIHPVRHLARTFQFQTINLQRIHIKPGPYEKHSIFNMCRNPSMVIDEHFIYNHKEQIFKTQILNLYKSNIKFLNFNHPKKNSDIFVQWFKDYTMWLNTIQNDKDHLIISTDGSYRDGIGTAAFAMWMNHILINSLAIQVSAHSAYDTELQAIQLAMEHMEIILIKKITLLVDNEAAAKTIWHTDCHNLQYISIKAMTHFQKWMTHWKMRNFIFNILWCPAHMDVQENELVDSIASEVIIMNINLKTTLESEIQWIKKLEFDAWNRTSHQHNGLGHGYLQLKYKGKRIGPSLGS